MDIYVSNSFSAGAAMGDQVAWCCCRDYIRLTTKTPEAGGGGGC
jgi:hypothetical protein